MSCLDARQCTQAQYETSPVTSTSDRVCGALTGCSSAEYQSQPPTATSDRTCASLTTCTAEEIEFLAPTPTSDRGCVDATVCHANEYESVAATATTDRVCSNISDCGAGQEEASAPTASTDRICVACAAGTFNPDGEGSCAAHSTCPSGEGASSPPTASSDRICNACTLGSTFVKTPNGPCHPVTPCPAWQEEIVSPSLTSDRVCRPCDLGLTYFDSDSAACAPVTVCTANEIELRAPTPTSDRECAGATVCRTGEYESVAATATTDRVCSSISDCAAGEEEASAPTTSTDRICVVCAAGTFNPDGEGSCAVHTNCASGEGERTPPTATSDRICNACNLGSTFANTINGPCQPVTPCPALQEESISPTLTTDRVCQPCDLGLTYFESDSATCINTTVCPPGAREQPPATLSADRGCVPGNVPCASGQTPDNTSCVCPDDDVCMSCMLPLDFGATLLLLDELPQTGQTLGACTRPALTGRTLYDACLAACEDNLDCVAFNVQGTAGECCLHSSFGTPDGFLAPGAAFYTMPQCDTCARGYYKSGRHCLSFAVPPKVDGGLSTRVLQIPLATAINATLLSIAAEPAAGFGPLKFQVDSPLLRISPDGNLELATTLESATTFSATIFVSDNRTSCTVASAKDQPITNSGPCTVAVPVTVRVAVFLSCPTAVNVFVGLDEPAAGVTWEEPRLPTFLGDLKVSRRLGGTNSSSAPFLYPVGQHRVTYTSEPLSVGGSITCAFDVVVRPGYSLTASSIARRASPRRVQEFLVVELGEANEGVRLTPIEGELRAGETLSIGVASPAGAPFAVTPVAGHEVHLIVDLEWCQAGATFEASHLLPGTLAVDMVTVAGSSSPPAFTDVGSGMTADGGCIRMRGQSAATSTAILFRELTVTLTADEQGDRRRRGDVRAKSSTVYLPARQYQIAVVTEAAAGGDLISLAGSTALEDTQPPVFLNCPVAPIEATAAPGALTAVATWEELAAVDNIVASPVVTGTHSSGATFSILASPHTVTYTASDGSLTSTCSFEVVVTYVAVTITAADAINSTFPATLQQSPLRYTSTVQQTLMGNGLGVVETLTALDTADLQSCG